MDYLGNYSKAGIITHSISSGKEDKAPVWYKENGKKEMTYKDKKDIQKRIEAYKTSEHDPERIGFFAGQQLEKYIITLDFDIYDKDTDSNSEYVTKEFRKICKMFNREEAFQYFETSTCGNYGCLLDITECKDLIELIKNNKDKDGKEREKYSYKGLEAFVNGSNVVLPPTITICKKHKKQCQARTFYSERYNSYDKETKEYKSSKVLLKQVYSPTEINEFTEWLTNFINLVSKPKKEVIETKPKETKTKTTKVTKEVDTDDEENETILNNLVKKEKKKKENIEKKKKETKEKTQKLKETLATKLLENDDINDKMLRKLLDCMEEERFTKFENWFKLTTIVKNAFGADYYNTYDEYNQKYNGYNEEKNKQIWNSIKLEKYNIGYLVYLAKEDNPEKYKEYQKLFNTEIIINEKTIADYIHMYNNNFIIQDNILYYFNNRTWEYGKKAENYMKGYISNELYMFLLSDILINYASSRDYVNLVKDLQKYCMTTKHKEQVIKTLFENKPTFDNSDKIVFDLNENIFMFTNGCYDLNQDKFIYCNRHNTDYFRSLYVTLDCGYNYDKPTEPEIKFMNNLLDKILLNKDHKNKFLEIIATGLIAKLIQKMHIFLGGGGNGKSLIMEYVKQALGSYYLTGEVELIMTNSKATSTAIASLHNKRLCCFSEPDSGERKISNSHFKALIGEKEITGKLLYENSCIKNNNNTFIILTNDMPKFKTNISNGEIRRIDVVKFNATFTDNISLVDNKTVFKADDSLGNTETQIKYRHAFFYILTQAYKEYKQRNFRSLTVDEFEKEKKNYIAKSEVILQNIFNLIEEDNTKYIKIKDLLSRIRETETYTLMSATDKKKFTKENLNQYIETNILFKNKYIDKRDCKCLLGYKLKMPDRDDFEDDGDYKDEVERIKRLNYDN
jgi:phage/plasmid-associated DNA primase